MKRIGLLVSLATLVAAAIFIVASPGRPAKDVTPTEPSEPILDGSYIVGKDIAPGVWHTDGPRAVHAYGVIAPSQCAWRIGFFEMQDNVTAMADSAHSNDSGPTDVSLGPVGATFETKGCRGWRPVTP